MVANINLDTNDPYSAVDSLNAGEFTISPESFGSIYQASISGNISLTDLNLSDNAVLVTQGTRQAVVQLQTFSKSPSPRTGAWAMMDQIQDIFQSESSVDSLWNTYGIRLINFGVISDISAIAGGSWESRCNADVTINLDSASVRPTNVIDAINFSLTTKAPGGIVSWTDTFSF